MSPTIHVTSGEPPHVHVGAGGGRSDDAKFWLNPVSLADAGRFNRREIQRMERIVQEQQAHFLEEWHDYQNRI